MGQPAPIERELRDAIAQRLGPAKYSLWFGEDVRLGVDGDSLTVGVPNGFFREWIQGHFSGNLIEAAQAVVGRPLRLAFSVDAEIEPKANGVDSDSDRPPIGLRAKPTVPMPIAAATGREAARPPRPSRRLDDFISGPGSKLALAAAAEMARTMGSGFNPLVIHGGVGLGKTHLLEGIGTAMRSRHPASKVVHLTAEAFTNGFLDSMRSNVLSTFRARYRGADALIVDDIHFLSRSTSAQSEFLHTFNALIRDGAPIVLATDQHPRQIAKLTDELTTRFLGGMVVKLDAPDPSTRLAILKAKAAARSVDVPEEVLSYIASHLRTSVRELEGALHSLIAHALLSGKRLDMSLAQTALRDTIRHTAQAVALKDVERAVCRLFEISADALNANSRSHTVVHPRMLAMYLARKHTGAAYGEIGRFFGGRNHSTVISAEKKVALWLKEEQRYRLLAGFETIAEILAALEREIGA